MEYANPGTTNRIHRKISIEVRPFNFRIDFPLYPQTGHIFDGAALIFIFLPLSFMLSPWYKFL
jgi:hypothetical protein